jgi:hypothetical protein
VNLADLPESDEWIINLGFRTTSVKGLWKRLPADGRSWPTRSALLSSTRLFYSLELSHRGGSAILIIS